ncbi:MAG TPA: cytochrome P450 [Acidimicrobiales bacterium]|jgi:cholest-4-en-3-one 26-monooxygenase|nr:cytochrome P450 [Acidimicrobiales bacterium]
MGLEEIDLIDGRNFVQSVPHHWFKQLRTEAPVFWHPEAAAPRGGFWAVTGYDDCVTVNRDWERFSSARRGSLFGEMEDDQLAQQQMMMVNMDPTMHTRYRRLVNKGFTPKMVRDLEAQILGYADGIIDAVCERGTADFVEEISAELPLLVIAELLGVPQEDRRMVFDWSNQMIGSEDPEYQIEGDDAGEAAMQVYAYAEEMASERRLAPRQDLVSVLLDAEVEGEKLDQLEIDLFFLLLVVAGNETTRNLMSGAMTAFFDHPEQWEILRNDRSLLPGAVEEMLRFVTPVMHFRRTVATDTELGGQALQEGDKVVFWHTSANRDEKIFTNPDAFEVSRTPNNHIAFGGGGPHFCLGANLARMEIMVMFDRLLDRIPDIRLDGEVERLQSNFINGTKHIPVAFAPSAPIGGTPLPARAR